MLAKDISPTLDGTWETVREATIFPTATTRINLHVERCEPNFTGIFVTDNEDPVASDQDFANTFIKTLQPDLCIDNEMALMEVLAQDLTEWAKHLPPGDTQVIDFLQGLMDKHKIAIQNN